MVRFKNRKAQYLLEAWVQKENFFKILNDDVASKMPVDHIRSFLVGCLNGLSYKTASQFLRNAYGIKTLAILDVHILRWLNIKKPPTTFNQYGEIEKTFQQKAKQYHVLPAELDAILFVRGSQIFWKDFR